jgi:outer membrane protein OmpA-like peptidoglycan-associated protein
VPVVGKASVIVPPLSVAKTTASGVPVICKISKGSEASCTIVLTSTVHGKSVVVGTGKRTVTGTHSSTVVTVKLNAKGKVLAAAPGGFNVTVKASIVPRGSKKAVTAKRSTRIVSKTTALVRPVFFALNQSVLRTTDAAYLNALRRHLAGVKSVSCSGYTDNQGNVAYNLALGKQRAVVTCAYLLRGLHLKGLISTYGLDRPHASNGDSQGQALNRRVTLVLHY